MKLRMRIPHRGVWVIFILCFLLLSLVADDWRLYRADLLRTGITSEMIAPRTDGEPLKLKWATSISQKRITSTPTVAWGRLYVGTEEGDFLCLSALTGQIIWSYKTGGYVRSSPAFDQGRVYVGSRDGYLYCLHGGTGRLLWKAFHGGVQNSSPVVAAGAVFCGIGFPSTEVRAYDALTGTLLWNTPLGQMVDSSPAIVGDRLIVGANHGRWYALRLSDGQIIWEYVSGQPGVYLSTPAVNPATLGSVVIAPGEKDRYLYLLDVNSGALIWKLLPSPSGVQTKPSGPEGIELADLAKALVGEEDLIMLAGLSKQERDEYLDGLAEVNNQDYTPVKEYLDALTGAIESDTQQKPTSEGTGTLQWSPSRAARTSSPVFTPGGRIFITQREIAYGTTSEWICYCVDSGGGGVLWNTAAQQLYSEDTGYAPSPAVASDTYVYIPIGTKIQVHDVKMGTNLGSVNVGADITTSVTLANARIYVGTGNGRLVCYEGLNTPPWAPTECSPSGGENISSSTPTISWSGAGDLEGPIRYDLQILVGEGDIELARTGLIHWSGQTTSYTFSSPVPPNTHIFYRIRVRDAHGAYSSWTPVHDFWANKDAIAPEPPPLLFAIPMGNAMLLEWWPSPSSDVAKYRIYWRLLEETFSTERMGEVSKDTNHYIVYNLENLVKYEFMVTAVDGAGNESMGIKVQRMPRPPIMIGTRSFPTLPDAVRAALPGDTIDLGYGVFNLSGALQLAQFHIRGLGPRFSVIRLSSGTALKLAPIKTAQEKAFKYTVSGISILQGTVGIDVGNQTAELRNILIANLGGDGIVADSGAELDVINVTIVNNLGTGIRSSSTSTMVKNSVIGKNGGYGIDAPQGVSLSYNDVYGNWLGNYSAGLEAGTGSISKAAIFRDEAGSDYRMQSQSPTVDAGDPADEYYREPPPNGERINQGAFGNTEDAAPSPSKPELVGTQESGSRGGGGGGCYIATASMVDTATLSRLYRFRDTTVVAHPAGAVFVAIYNAYGPKVAKLIARSPQGRGIVRATVVATVKGLEGATKSTWVLALFALLFIGLGCVLSRRAIG